MLHAPRDLVVLIPGFLGFETVFNVHYFGEFVAKHLRDCLAANHIAAEVAVADTLPAGSLLRRRERLVKSLAKLAREHGAERIHLVGHSTGGLDAYALATNLAPSSGCDATTAASDTRHAEDDEARVRARIRTVVTLAAPMRGTSIVQAPRVVDARGPAFALKMFGLLDVRAQFAIATDPMTLAMAPRLAFEPRALFEYVRELSTDNELVRDLAPDSVAKWIRREARDELVVAHFVTVAANSWSGRQPGSEHGEGSLYATAIELMHEGQLEVMTQARAHGWPAIASRLGEPKLIASERGRRAVANATDIASDGIVDAGLQFIDAADVRAVVVGDHLDVLGHFGGGAAAALALGGRPFMHQERGFLYSGSGFNEQTFRALWTEVARAIAPRLALEGEAAARSPRARRSLRELLSHFPRARTAS